MQSRTACLRKLAELYESNAEELFALAAREAGKNWLDAVGEIREAVDFALFYANEAERKFSSTHLGQYMHSNSFGSII